MITAMMGLVSGLVSGVVPDVLKEVRETRDHKREVEFIRLQHELQMQRLERQAGDKIEEGEVNVMLEEARAFKEHLTAIVETQARPTGIPWIDGLNAVLRPASAVMIIFLFVFVALGFSEVIQPEAFSLLYIQATEAVIGFLFGYRSVRKRAVNA